MLGRGGFLCCVGARGGGRGRVGLLVSERGWAAGFDGCRLCGGCSVLCGVGWNDGMPLPRAGAGMCARRRSNLSLASPRTSHQREGDPAVRVPFAALRGNLRCALQAGSAQTRLAAQTARGPDPPEAVLLGTARGEGEPGSPSGHRCARPGRRDKRAPAVGPDSVQRRHWGRSATVGSPCSATKRVLRPQSRNAGRTASFCYLYLRHRIKVQSMSGCCRPGAACGGR